MPKPLNPKPKVKLKTDTGYFLIPFQVLIELVLTPVRTSDPVFIVSITIDDTCRFSF
jgi:hypothetical protein